MGEEKIVRCKKVEAKKGYPLLGIKPYRKIAERYDRTAQRTLIKTGLRTGTEAGTTGMVKVGR